MQELPSTQPVSTDPRDMVSLEAGVILSEAWNSLKANTSLVLKIFGLLIIISIAANLVVQVSASVSDLLSLIAQLANMVVQMLLGVGTLYISIAVAMEKPVELSMLWKLTDRLAPYFIVSMLYGLLVSVDFLLLIFPGIIWATKYGMAAMIVAWKKMNAMDAMHLSAQMTNGYKWQLFVLYLVFLVINVAAALALMVGLLITIPLSYLAMGIIFAKLAAQVPELQQEEQPIAPAI